MSHEVLLRVENHAHTSPAEIVKEGALDAYDKPLNA